MCRSDIISSLVAAVVLVLATGLWLVLAGSAVGALVESEDVTTCVGDAVLLTWLSAIMPPAPPAVSAAATTPSAFAFATAVGVR